MINFKVYIKKNGVYQSIHDNEDMTQNANAVFPFTVSQLLDEQLDEARLIIKNSPDEYYKSLTEVKIELLENGNVVKEYYFVVAQDNAFRFPVGEK